MRNFREAIGDCGIGPVDIVGPRKTWRRGSTYVQLDRALVSTDWFSLFPGSFERLI